MIPDEAVEAAGDNAGWTREKLLRGVDYLVISGGGSAWRRFRIVQTCNGYAIEEDQVIPDEAVEAAARVRSATHCPRCGRRMGFVIHKGDSITETAQAVLAAHYAEAHK